MPSRQKRGNGLVDSKVKVIHIITRLDKGGSAENTMLTVLGLARQGYEVILVRGDPQESAMSEGEQQSQESSIKEAESLGVRIVTVPSLIRRVNPFWDLLAFLALFRLIRKECPQIVHTHTSKAGILGRLAAWPLNQSAIRHPCLAGRQAQSAIKIIHTPHGHVFYGHFGRLMTTFFIRLERFFAKFTHRIITLTEQGAKEHLQLGVGRGEQFIAIHSGVDLQRLQALPTDQTYGRNKLGLPASCALVGTVGKMVPIKGHAILISAAAEVIRTHPTTHFVIVGEGALERELQDQGKMLSLEDHLHFVKAWGEEAWAWMASFDLFVLPSLNEGMGRVLIEAMAFGKPVVASRVGGIPEIVLDGKTGILVPPKDPKRLAEAVIRLLSDPERARQMGEEGKKRIDSRFSADAMVLRIDHLYQELLKAA